MERAIRVSVLEKEKAEGGRRKAEGGRQKADGLVSEIPIFRQT